MSVKIYAMTCGWITADTNIMLSGKKGRITIPVPAYLIDHPRGLVLFDTGIHPACEHQPEKRLGKAMADLFEVKFRVGQDIRSRLEILDVDAGRIEFLINSHLHFDHTGGNELVPNARIIIQQREWEAGRIPELIKANGYLPADYNHGHLVQAVDGEHDLFGDGRIVTIPTYGHTPGHQSLKVRLDSGDMVLTADACYFKETLENLHLPFLVHDRIQMLNTLMRLRSMQRAGARIVYGHDPEFWSLVPQAPEPFL